MTIESRKHLLFRSLKGRAEVYTLISKYEDAKSDYERLEASFKNSPAVQIEAYLGLGYISELVGDYEMAEKLYNKAFKLSEEKALFFEKA